MATIAHILLALLLGILRAFTQAFVLLFSRALYAVLAIVALLLLILGLTGTLGIGLFRRRS